MSAPRSSRRVRVAALTGPDDRPSSRFRVRQFERPLLDLGIELRDYPLAKRERGARASSWWNRASLVSHWGRRLVDRAPGLWAARRADVTLLSRSLIGAVPSVEPLIPRPLVLDVDDAIWLTRPWGEAAAAAVGKRADVVTAGNRHLAAYFSQYCREVVLVPTSLDTTRFVPNPQVPPAGRFVIGWTGSSSTMRYLHSLERPLRRFLETHRDSELVVVSNAPPQFEGFPPGAVRFVAWRQDIEVSAVQGMHVGLMPLEDSPWARGKCAFKMIQYMACGIPSIVSPVGANQEILDTGEVGWAARDLEEWLVLLELAYADASERDRRGGAGRRLAVERYDIQASARVLASTFHRVSGGG